MRLASVLSLALLCTATGCPRQPSERIEQTFTFETSAEGWRGSFADYPAGREQDFNLVFDRRPLPQDVDQQGQALYLSGENLSDSLAMFLTREVTGLQPDTAYALTYELMLASNAGSNCAGIGGAPGESVFLKVGASRVEPQTAPDDQGTLRLNIDKGNQSNGGANAQVIGNIANGLEQCTGTPYRLISRGNPDSPFLISTDERGVLWLLVGTDSGFEGPTSLYYDSIRVVLEPQ